MSHIKLLRRGGRGHSSVAPLCPAPRPQPELGSEWWTRPWSETTKPLDDRCEEVLSGISRSFARVKDSDDPLGTPFFDLTLGERLPVALLQAVLRIPDEFAVDGARIVLRRPPDGSGSTIRVCDPAGRPVGMADESVLLNLDWWLERAAHWLFASNRVSPEMIREMLEQHLP